jgi:hypothetical protein
VHTRVARRSGNNVVVAALRGGNAEGIHLYAVGTGELDKGGTRWSSGEHRLASACYLGA